jgi:tRNA pseudouridine55 synthase
MKFDDLDGVLLLDKEPGMTSHDVVAMVRRKLSIKRVGHCGTLDPMATGLLIVVLGRATKIQDLLMAEDKEYLGAMHLGVTTDSQDAEGEILETRLVLDFSREELEAAFHAFRGDFYQTPPMVSAIKKDGVPLYKMARKGQVVAREPRFVHVFAHEIQSVEMPRIFFRVVCSKGFYVRTYAHDIGEKLGCGAHLCQLRRTWSGRFSVEKALSIADLRSLPPEQIAQRVLDLPTVSRLRGA